MAREMKDSGISWIEMIPENWHLIRIKFCSSLKGRIGWQGLTTAEYIDEGPYLVSGIDFKEGSIDWSHCNHVDAKRWEEDPFIQITNGDLLITKDGTVGKVAIVEGLEDKATLNSGVMLIRPTRNIYNTRYLYWILCSEVFKKWFSEINAGISTIIHLYQGDFFNFSFPLPSIDTQSIIASFLDTKCAEIDKAIESTKESIEEYKKLRQAIITEAVTKGLDPNVEMKDSGIEWIGEIPKYWRMTVISRIGNTCSGATPNRSNETSYFENANIRWVRTLDLNGGIVSDSSEKITEKALQESSCQIMPEGTVCIAMYGGSGTIGKCGLLSKPCTTNQAICSIVCDENLIVPKYLLYQMISIRKHWMLFAEGTRKDPNINQETVKKMSITLPPIKEQKDITLYLNTECSKIDSLIMSKEKLIEELTAYRKSLIFEYVTGKKEVPVESA